MTVAPFDLGPRFLERSRYYLAVEYPAKLRQATRALPDDRLWWRPHEAANSVGNLLVHLSGNVRQWIVSGVGGAPDRRHRDAEFAARDGASAEELVRRLDDTLREADGVLASLSAAALGEPRRIQGRETTVFAAVYHVVEHFSTHTGQVVLLAKMFAPGSIQFYDDAHGLARPTFLGDGASDH